MSEAHESINASSGAPQPRSTPDSIARWLGGLFVASVRYLFMRVPSYRRDRFDQDGAQLPDFSRDLPGDPDAIQRVHDGVGALYHRHFWIDLTDARLDREELIAQLASDLNAAAPGEVSDFDKGGDDASRSLEVGAELLVRLPGPWDGPVRVVERTPTSFRFVTLQGHMEAGEIEFRAETTERGYMRFSIETWARSGDPAFMVLNDIVPIAREAQAFMWAHFCARIPKLAGGIVMSNVAVNTQRFDTGAWLDDTHADRPIHTTAPMSGRAKRALFTLPGRDYNFDPDDHDAHTEEQGWNLDDYRVGLPDEPAGPPVDGGPFEIACAAVERYEFPDPDIVRAAWFDDVPLARRHLLLEARFLFLRFRFGLKVGSVLDRTEQIDERPVRRWGFDYRTLEGHLERGQMSFEVRKWLDTGAVEFRIHAYSRRAHIANPFVRFGMWLLGRSQQLRFADHALERMQRLVEQRHAHDDRRAA